MKLLINEKGLSIIPKNKKDNTYIKNVLGLKKDGDYIKLYYKTQLMARKRGKSCKTIDRKIVKVIELTTNPKSEPYITDKMFKDIEKIDKKFNELEIRKSQE